MSPQNPPRRSENETTLLAWQAEIARSVETPWLAQALAARVTDLLPRVARCHAQLRTLPRRTRRAWQRQLARSSDLTAILEDWSQRRVGRAIQRQLARSVAGAALLLALAPGVGHAATITVNTSIPAINAADGKCSLIEAIVNANDDAQTHLDCTAGSGADIIVLPKATHALSLVNNVTFEATGLPVITSPITIEGNDAKITRKGGSTPAFRLIAVGATGDLTLKDVTLSGGNAGYRGGAIYNEGVLTIQNSAISGNDAGYHGGGIYSVDGTLTIENSTISGNTVGKGGRFGDGGGIYLYSGTATITNSTISGNQADGAYFNSGGGISIRDYASMTIDNSIVSNNKAGGNLANRSGASVNYGGGISIGRHASMTIDNSIVSNNEAGGVAAYGGGIRNLADLTITNSTVSGNQAAGKHNYGGGIENHGTLIIENSTISGNKTGGTFSHGGGIVNGGIANLGVSTATIENSTISGNKAGGKYGHGGGIASLGTLTITNSTISGNKAAPNDYGYGGGIENLGRLTLQRSLISGNEAGCTRAGICPSSTAPEVDNTTLGTILRGTVIADNFNLFGSNGDAGTNFPPGLTDIVPGVALGKILGGLAANGGPTKTHALKLGSPAVDAVTSGPACPATDQRGVLRPQGSACDIGAFELE